jgi:hypothetical protein
MSIRIDPTFYFDADPDPDADWHQNNADPHADHTPSFTHNGKWANFFTVVHSNASLRCFSFIISGNVSSILDILLKFP